tara:strand:- start:314 stop:514 length:201 start_codon:yes stop_codon:yes gene_type:complete
MLIQKQVGQSFNKVIATIESCKTREQLDGAIKMVENFKKMYRQVGYTEVLLYKIKVTLKKQSKKCL